MRVLLFVKLVNRGVLDAVDQNIVKHGSGLANLVAFVFKYTNTQQMPGYLKISDFTFKDLTPFC